MGVSVASKNCALLEYCWRDYNLLMFHKLSLTRSTASRLFPIAGLLVAGLLMSTFAESQDAAQKRGRKYKAPPATAHFEVTVTRATNGKPVENASVIFHPLQDGHDDGNMELKTNDEGKAALDLLEVGTNVRLQIIAPGFQTYGEDFKVDKENLTVAVKLKRPAEQYSVYKKSEGKNTPDPNAKPAPDTPKSAAPDNATEPQKDAPDASKDSPKEDVKPQTTPPN